MSPSLFGPRQAQVLWLDPLHLRVKGLTLAHDGLPTEAQLTQALQALPAGPTLWIIDDLLAPAMILRDVMEAPTASEAREQFFRWRYTQTLGLEAPQAVHAVSLGEAAWLLAGLPLAQREAWSTLAARLGRPIHALVPRWLWLYNRLAPGRDLPGMLLSLAPAQEGGWTGSLAAWGRNLAMVRQWGEPADAETWMADRIAPTAAFLHREGRPPQECWVWGASAWPSGDLPVRIIQPEIPQQEAL